MHRHRWSGVLLGTLAASASVLGFTAASAASPAKPSHHVRAAAYSNPSQGVLAKQLNVGIISDETGPTTATQIPWRDGIDTYLRLINKQGGVYGRKIVVDQCDEQYQVAPAMVCYKTMTSSSPQLAIMGLNDSDFQAAAMPLVRQQRMPIVGAESTNQESVNPFAPSFFALECTYPAQADVSVAFGMGLIHNYHASAVSLVLGVASGLEYGNTYIKERVLKAGGKYLGTFALPPTASNADAEAQQVAALHPQLIFMHGSPESSILFLKSLAKFGVKKTPIIGIFATEDPTVAKAVPAYEKYFYAVNCYDGANQPNVPGGHGLIKAAKAAGYPASIYTSTNFTNGYVVGETLVQGLLNAGPKVNRAALVNGLAKIKNFDTGLSPTVTFGPRNRIGIQEVRPYKFDPKFGTFAGVGQYAQYAACVADNEYITNSIAKWSPRCVPSSVYASLKKA